MRFVTFLIGPNETPFTVPEGLLCYHSVHYRENLKSDAQGGTGRIEKLVVDPQIFGYIQNWLYREEIHSRLDGTDIPDSELLLSLWETAHNMQIDSLREATLKMILDHRPNIHQSSFALWLREAWETTQDGSKLREELFQCAMELIQHPTPRPEIVRESIAKRRRCSTEDAPVRKKRCQPKSNSYTDKKKDVTDVSPADQLEFCKHMIAKMYGRGYWARFTPAFQTAVDPTIDNAPDYLEVVKQPMDLSIIRHKLDNNTYEDSRGFLADMRLMFSNCYQYWQQNDGIYSVCTAFDQYFHHKFDGMGQWVARKHAHR